MLQAPCTRHKVVTLHELAESLCRVTLALQLQAATMNQSGHADEVVSEKVHDLFLV